MSHKKRRILSSILIAAVLLLGALAYAIARNRKSTRPAERPSTVRLTPQTQEQVKAQTMGMRNLSLQPSAFNLGRRLGKRFAANARETSSMTGTLTIGSERRSLQIARKQTTDGEQIQITFADDSKSLTWDTTNGALSSGARATSTDRDLIERLLLDSPDQFVLAQLRGASYYTVARNVRPAKADDKYAGPLWDIVRVNNPQHDADKKPQSAWRLYYLNTMTGLIDRIVCELDGQTITAEFTWTESNGEKIPAQITWTRQGQILMRYEVGTFSHADLGARS